MRRNVRGVLVLAVAALVVSGGLGAAGPALATDQGPDAGYLPVTGRPTNGFLRNGPWNTRLPAHVPLAPNSQAIVNNIKADKENNYGSWAINTDEYSAPIYRVDQHTPTQRWTFSDCLDRPDLAPVIADSLAAVPTPADMIVSKGSDASVAIYQPSTDT